MGVELLRAALGELRIRESACLVLPTRVVEGALCLLQDEEGWRVAANERGEWVIDERFEREEEACRFFLREVISDPSYRRDFKQTDLDAWERQVPALLKRFGLT
jgi:hypothetical protein